MKELTEFGNIQFCENHKKLNFPDNLEDNEIDENDVEFIIEVIE